jgi:hypothetical protein
MAADVMTVIYVAIVPSGETVGANHQFVSEPLQMSVSPFFGAEDRAVATECRHRTVIAREPGS